MRLLTPRRTGAFRGVELWLGAGGAARAVAQRLEPTGVLRDDDPLAILVAILCCVVAQ